MGIPAGFNPCLRCPEYLEYRENEEANVPNYVKGICVGCGQERMIFVRRQICQKCLKAGKQGLVSTPATELPDPQPQPDPPAPIDADVPQAFAKAAAPIRAEVFEKPSLASITIDLSRVNGLAELLLQEAHRDIRTPEAQALVILRTSLLEVQP